MWKKTWFWWMGLTLAAFLAGISLHPLLNKDVIPPVPPVPPPCDALTYSTGCGAFPSSTGLVANPTKIQYIPASPLPIGYGYVTVTNPAGSPSSVAIADLALSACVSTGWERVGPDHMHSCDINLINSGGFPSTLAPGQSMTLTVLVTHYSRRAKLEFMDSGGIVLLTVPISS